MLTLPATRWETRLRRFRTALACSVLAAALFGAAARPASAADQIVWEALQTVDIANEDGTNRRTLASTCSGGSPRYPALSPDGQTVAFTSYAGLCVVNVNDGGWPKVIATGQSIGNADFTPDGRTLVVEALPNNGFDIHKIPVSGGALSLVIGWAGDQGDPTVSPDGTKIAFYSDKTPAGKALTSPHVYVTSLSGANPIDLGIGTDPSFSSNGASVAFVRGGNIYTSPTAGGRAAQLTKTGLDTHPDWSPNGQIAFIRRTSAGTGTYNIWQMTSSGANQTMLIQQGGGGVYAPSYRQPSTALDYHDLAAAKYRPVLLFDSGERWRPLNITSFLGETHRVCDGSRCEIVSSPEGLRLFPSSNSRIDIEGDGGEANYASPAAECNVSPLQDCDTGFRSSIYYHVSDPSPLGYRYIDYWFFYRYNDTPDISFTDHEGDWESVTIAPSGTLPDTFDFASFSGHGHWFSYLRDNLACEGGTRGSCGTETAKTGRRVNTYVAAGSHANYAEPCGGPCTQSNSPIPEMDHDGLRSWGRNYDPPADAVREFPATRSAGQAWTAGPQNWTDWPGLWSVNGGIQSPGNQGHFSTPWVNECADGTDCPNETFGGGGTASTREQTLADCSSWFGPDVTAVACDPAALKRSLQRRELGRKGSFTIAPRGGRTAATAPGIAQILGRPVGAGEALGIVGRGGRGARLLVRVKRAGQLYEAMFRSVGLGSSRGRAVLRVAPARGSAGNGQPRLALVQPSGRIVRPTGVRKVSRPG